MNGDREHYAWDYNHRTSSPNTASSAPSNTNAYGQPYRGQIGTAPIPT